MKKRQSVKTNVKNSVKNKKTTNKIHWGWIFGTVFQIVGFFAVLVIVGMLISYVK